MESSLTFSCTLSNQKDPYHGPQQAHGLCFSVLKGVAVPPSLKNMYKELKSDISGFVIPKHGMLQCWAGEGVLLLNTTLTVRGRGIVIEEKKRWAKNDG